MAPAGGLTQRIISYGVKITMDNKLYILTYEHGGYVLWKDAVKPRLKELLSWMEKYPKLKIGLDYESFTFDEFSKCDPEIVELCKELMSKYPDRVGLGATTYGQPLSLFISEESNIRQLTYAIRTNLKFFGKTPSVYAISEFALNNQIPQMIKLCGYEAAILRSHVMGYGYPRTFDSAWGKWIGKDNSAVDAVPTYDGQGRGFNCTTVDNWILSRWPHDTEISLDDFQKKFSKYSPLLASRYDDLTQNIEEVTKHIETKENCEYILLEDIPALYGQAKDELKTTDNDFHVQMPWGYCGNEIFNGGRKAEVEAAQAEKLNALSVMLGGEPLYESIEQAWKNALINQHHDVMICGLLDLARRFIPESLKYSNEVRSKSLESIADYFKSGSNGAELAVNMHSFPVDEWIEHGGELKHIVLPPLTAKKVEKDAQKYAFSWDEEDEILTTPSYKIKLSEKGIEYIDLLCGERLVDNRAKPLFTAVVDDVPCSSSGGWQVTLSDSGAKAKYCGSIGSVAFEFNMRLFGDSKRIDCDTRFEAHGQRIGSDKETCGRSDSFTINGHWHTEKLCFNLDLKLKNSRKMYRDLPFSISEWSGDVRKTEDYWYEKEKIIYDERVSAEESFNSTTHVDGIYWLALRDEEKGLAIFNRGCMGSAVSGNLVQVPLVYSHDYMCGTRILDGVFTDEFALMPVDSSVSNAELHRLAMSYNYLPSLTKAGACGNSPLTFASLEASGGELILTSLYPENGKIFARFCNFSDEGATAVFSTQFGKLLCETDLLGKPLSQLRGNSLCFRPWEIKTVSIEIQNR